MGKINEREIAAYALIDILNEGAYNNIVLRRILRQNNALASNQKAFITDLVNGSIRNLIYLDHIISQFSKTPMNKIKPFILSVLRISVYQLFFMDRVPQSAVLNEAVNLVKDKGFGELP